MVTWSSVTWTLGLDRRCAWWTTVDFPNVVDSFVDRRCARPGVDLVRRRVDGMEKPVPPDTGVS